MQTILDPVEFTIDVKEIGQQDNIIEAVKSCMRAFDLAKAPLFRVYLIQITNSKSLMVIDMHHIITAGTTMGLLVKDFVNYLNGNSLLKPKHTYRDYVLWQNTKRELGDFNRQKEFWLQHLAGRSSVLSLLSMAVIKCKKMAIKKCSFVVMV